MELLTMHPGVDFDEIRAATSWLIASPARRVVTAEPRAEDLGVLRTEVDRDGHYLGR